MARRNLQRTGLLGTRSMLYQQSQVLSQLSCAITHVMGQHHLTICSKPSFRRDPLWRMEKHFSNVAGRAALANKTHGSPFPASARSTLRWFVGEPRSLRDQQRMNPRTYHPPNWAKQERLSQWSPHKKHPRTHLHTN